MQIQEELILRTATFNPKVKTYIFFVGLWLLLISIIGIVLLPIWILGFGQWISVKFFNTLKCELSTKNLKFSKGLIIHIEKTIPLENIQDLSFIGGPILRYFGLTLIKVETAGGGGMHKNSNMMSMLGIEQADEFKMAILNQREILKNSYNNQSQNVSVDNDLSIQLLSDIKTELVSIKQALTQTVK